MHRSPWPPRSEHSGPAEYSLVLGAALGDWKTLGVAYLGAACSVAFAIDESYRGRVMALAAASLPSASLLADRPIMVRS